MTEKAKTPAHIAIILDGNGRWAKQRGLTRIKGHTRGADTVTEITQHCAKRKVKQLTFYTFSQENWKRPKLEIRFLMRLITKYLIKERKNIEENNIRLTAIGRIDGLPENVRKELAVSIEESKNNTGMVLCLALNYGGRSEIVDAAKKIAREVECGNMELEDVTEESFNDYLYMPNMPDPDLLIRTGGEIRISNFLLWEVSYTELWFTRTCWPDFSTKELDEAIKDYGSRERRFGGVIRG
ncbi:MAG: uppS [Candidatus Brocadiaceae bacterium]|nr:uppS [Candidatus Brocadiaceae bacterium]